ncbi:MAG TPA: response regulator [Tepidisphaeraceae bacterium]|nr:response regulator [Tepidisphaeraceae bacterium]
MASAMLPPTESASKVMPRLLVVDDESDVLELLRDAISAKVSCKLVTAKNLASARSIIESQPIDVLLTDLHLPDGDGMSLMPVLKARQPAARALIITGQPTVESAVGALRAGAIDFVPKPFNIDQIIEHVDRAIHRQTLIARNEKRIDRLKDAVRRLNQSRKVVTRKVDLLCNDLISAYGEVSKQVEEIRNQESFRRLLESSKDLEQMLCHAMDWILRQAGYCNLAVWLAADDAEYQLGAYMKYTIPGEPALTDAIRQNLVPMTAREGTVQLEGHALKKNLTAGEHGFLKNQTVLSQNCTYLGESLAVLTLFRDEKCPFTDADLAMVKAIAPVFATALAGMVRKTEGDDRPDEYGEAGGTSFENSDEDEKKRREKKKKEQHDADWWKRGDPPPF